jgi:hypothetical protein
MEWLGKLFDEVCVPLVGNQTFTHLSPNACCGGPLNLIHDYILIAITTLATIVVDLKIMIPPKVVMPLADTP